MARSARRAEVWRERNFPTSNADQQLLGVVEEVGELAHANLKSKQGIRGTPEMHVAAEEDAVGDILIYLLGYCSYKEWDMADILEETAKEILKRDWIEDPLRGGETVATRIRNSEDQDPNYQRLDN